MSSNMNGLKNPGFSQSLLKYEQTLSKVITTIVKYVMCYIISAIYSGGLDARRESSENWNNLLFFGKSEVGSFFGKVSFSTRHKNDKLDCTLQRTCIGTILFFCLFLDT